MNTFVDNLTQGERLTLAADTVLIPRNSIGEDERLIVTVSRPPDGFRMPSMASVRLHDARLSAYDADTRDTHDEEQDEERDEEDETREHVLAKRMDYMREQSFRLPSQRTRRDVFSELSSMGCGFHE